MTQSDFSKIAVIGAGTMGSGIAAQIANAGHDVLLLDLDARTPGDKTPAEMAIERLLASDPPQLMDKKFTSRISTGTIDADLEKLADYDWVIEAVVERLDIKKSLYKRLDKILPAHCIISSNTSTIPIRLLVEDMPTTLKNGLLSRIISIRYVICVCLNWCAVATPKPALLKNSLILMTAFWAKA